MSLEIKFFPLTFITSNDEILNQLRNTVLFSFLLQEFEETTLDYYLESTQYGYTASSLESGTHRMLRITDITNGKVDWNIVPYCDCESEERYLLKEGDVLIARTGGTTGKSFFVTNPPHNAVFASYLIRLRIREGVDLSFIERYLNSYVFWTQVIEMKSGTAMPNVNAEKLKTLRLPKCDLKTQEQFLSIFDTKNKYVHLHKLFNKLNSIEKLFNSNVALSLELTHQLSLVKQLRQAFLREAMQGKLVPQDAKDEPASELLKKIKEEKEQLIKEKKIKKEKELPPIKPEEIPFEIPENWVWCRLGEICIQSFYGPRFSNSDYVQNGIPTIRTTDMTDDGKIELKNTPCVLINDNEKLELYKVKDGDLLLTRSGSIGIMAIFRGKYLAIPSAYLIRFRFSSLMLPEFVYSLLKSPYWQELLGLNSKATAQVNINATNILKLVFPIPPVAEQHRIVTKLEQLIRYSDELEQSIKESQTQNEQLLQQVLREALQPKKEYEINSRLAIVTE